MATGQVGFKDQKKVKRVYVEKRENPIINRLNKTKVEKYPDFAQEREDRNKELRKKDRASQQARVRSNAGEDYAVLKSTNMDIVGQRGSTNRKGEEADGVGARTQVRRHTLGGERHGIEQSGPRCGFPG